MKRSQVNAAISSAERFLEQVQFRLPPFARLTPLDWAQLPEDAREIVETGLGWDVSDFGLDDFHGRGAVLFTLRNGQLNALATGTGKVYCEKIIVMTPDQTILHHFHKSKTEDIINRAGGQLELVLHHANPDGSFSQTDVSFVSDGVQQRVPAGGTVMLEAGQSITLEPLIYHQFRTLGQTVLLGEVSTVNDDINDNFFHQAVGRYSSIEEDEVPYRLLVTDYAAHTPFTTPQSSN